MCLKLLFSFEIKIIHKLIERSFINLLTLTDDCLQQTLCRTHRLDIKSPRKFAFTTITTIAAAATTIAAETTTAT